MTTRKRGGRVGKALTARDRKKVETSFEQGGTVEGTWEQIGRRVSRATVGRVKKEWDAGQSPSPVAEDAASEAPTQTILDPPCVAETEPVDVAVDVPVVEPSTNDAPTEKEGVSSTLRAQPVLAQIVDVFRHQCPAPISGLPRRIQAAFRSRRRESDGRTHGGRFR